MVSLGWDIPFVTPYKTILVVRGGAYRGTSLIRKRLPWDPTADLCVWSYGGPRREAFSYERGTPAHVTRYSSAVSFDWDIPCASPCKTILVVRSGAYRGTSLIRNRNPLGTNRRPMPRVLGES